MKIILTFVLVVTIELQTQSTTAHPVNSTSISNAASNSCDSTYAYCCKQRPTSSPSIIDIYEDLNGVIDILHDTCANQTIRDNVRVYSTWKCVKFFIIASIWRHWIYTGKRQLWFTEWLRCRSIRKVHEACTVNEILLQSWRAKVLQRRGVHDRSMQHCKM